MEEDIMIISSHFVTLDGVTGSPEQWHPAYASQESIDVLLSQVARVDGLLLGRRTFQEFAAYWPLQGDDVPVAKETNAIRKYVVSSTLGKPEWGPTEVLAGDPVRAVTTLNERGLTLFQTGGRLTRTLLAAGMIDEVQFYLDPFVAGEGLRLFDGFHERLRLELAECTRLPNGVLHLVYLAGGATG
jgi:dihydrofolate reductase